MSVIAVPNSTRSGNAVYGRTEPRLWTPPLRDLTPDTSYGFDVIDFARDVIGRPLDPWQEWLVIHGGELLPGGAPRFRKVLVLVARQNGKTELLVILSLYWLYVDLVELVLGTSTNLDYAYESWEKAVALVEADPDTFPLAKNGIRRTNGQNTLRTADLCRYKIAASNRKGGRSLTIKRLIMDELREHRDWSAWNAAIPAMNAVWDAQAWLLSNMGDIESIVLAAQREAALDFIETGIGDYRLGLFEWSAPRDAGDQLPDPTDIDALAQANPNLGHRFPIENIIGDAVTAKEAGGKQLTGFLTENMCVQVDALDPAINQHRWGMCNDETLTFPEVSKVNRVAFFEVSEDMEHATLHAGTRTEDDHVVVMVRKAWTSSETARAELLTELQALDPSAVGWIPAGPAAAFATILRPPKGKKLPGRIESFELAGGKVTEACQGLADLVKSLRLKSNDDPLTNQHVKHAKKQNTADGWRLARRDAGHVDAAVSAAGAAYLALTRPKPARPRIRVLQ